MSTATPSLRQQRCSHHPTREASARCPECGRFFCRECITEHEDRVLCATCLAKISGEQPKRKASRRGVVWVALALVSFCVVFFAFLFMGNLLLAIPSRFHVAEGW